MRAMNQFLEEAEFKRQHRYRPDYENRPGDDEEGGSMP